MLSKDLSQTKKNEEERSEKKEITGMKLTLTPFNVVFGFDENHKSKYKCFKWLQISFGLSFKVILG